MNKAKVIKSLIYKFIERFSVKSIGLVISIIQARLLAPEVFGQLSLLLVFTDLSLTVVDGGLNSALVQSKEVKERDYSTVFIITLGLTAVMIVLLYFAAPLIAGYYQSPALIMPLRFYSLSMFFSAFNSIQVARMQREMRFREMMYCSLAATLTAGTLGIAMAYKGAGLWALVGYYFSHIAVTCIAMFCTDRWIPRGKFSKDSAKRLYGFGIKMLASSMITTIYNDIRPLIIGKKFSTADLGYYERGQRFSTTVSRNLDTAVQSVMFPVMAQAQDDKKQVRAMLRRAQTMGEFVIFPAMVGMSAVAEPMVRLLLTEKWMPCVIFVQVLCIAEMQTPITSANLVAVKALGRSDILMKQELLRRTLMIIVLLITVFVFNSVEAIAYGFLFSAWLDAIITSMPVKQLLDYGFADQAKDMWRCALAAVIMGAAVAALNLLNIPDAAKLAVQIITGAAVYAAACAALKVESFTYVLNMLKKHKDSKKASSPDSE